MVTMRSLSGIIDDSTLSSVVLPLPVPPLMRMFMRPVTQAARKSPTWLGEGPESHEVVEGQHPLGELPDGELRAVDGERWDDGIDA